MRRTFSLLTAALAMLVTAACVLSPGKFSSELLIGKDRQFTFRYQGELYALDPDRSLSALGATPPKADGESGGSADKSDDAEQKAPTSARAKKEAKYHALASAFSKEQGVKKMTYVGDGKFELDYEISGRLDHSFVFPFNTDAEIALPFIGIELRNDGTARLKAPGFVGSSNRSSEASGLSSGGKGKAEGTFIVRTDTEVLMHNNEAGIQRSKGQNVLKWDITPLTKQGPTMSFKFAQ